METVAGLTGNDWPDLAYQLYRGEDSLTVKAQIIDYLDSLPNKSPYAKCIDMLNMWKMGCENPSKEELIIALQNIKKTAIVKKLTEDQHDTYL